MRNEILNNLLGSLAIIVALTLVWGFWLYLVEGVLIALPFMLGYIFIVINLIRFKKWAFEIFLTAVVLSILFWFLVMITVGLRFSVEASVDWLLAIFVLLSSIIMLIFGVLALIRRLCMKK